MVIICNILVSIIKPIKKVKPNLENSLKCTTKNNYDQKTIVAIKNEP